jgi:hypothetical protein
MIESRPSGVRGDELPSLRVVVLLSAGDNNVLMLWAIGVDNFHFDALVTVFGHELKKEITRQGGPRHRGENTMQNPWRYVISNQQGLPALKESPAKEITGIRSCSRAGHGGP